MARVKERIASAALRGGRDPAGVTLVAVTKTVPAERVREVLACGVTHVGESRVREAREKLATVPAGTVRHFIGRLQTNKARDAVGWADIIHSLDRLDLAAAVARAAEAGRRKATCLVQVNITGAPDQGGVAPDNAERFVESCLRMPYLHMVGTMTIGPHPATSQTARDAFERARALHDRLAALVGADFRTFSAGMSGDFEEAVEAGSTLVRIGTAIFGERSGGA